MLTVITILVLGFVGVQVICFVFSLLGTILAPIFQIVGIIFQGVFNVILWGIVGYVLFNVVLFVASMLF